MEGVIIVINPGSTSTRMALFRGKERIAEETVRHDSAELAPFDNVADQFDLRMAKIDQWLASAGIDSHKVAALAGRGAPLRPLQDSIYAINEKMLDDLRTARYSNHASNLGALIADHLRKRFNVPAVIVEPITTDNLTDFARISGIPEIVRKSRSHALNIKEVCRREAENIGKDYTRANFVVAHMGGGISVAAVKGGLIVDVNDGLLGMGPFSPERAGALPIGGVVEMCFSGKYTREEIINKFSRESGFKAYLGTADLRAVEKMIDAGDEKAELYFGAMVYQIAKEIGACAAVLKGGIDGIIFTGGMAHSARLVKQLSEYVSTFGKVTVVAGEYEMEALAAGALRVLEGIEIPKEY
ncbi:MAG: butyrate kinase [candidate division Zixibacteria bacterium HGW-Zixibacteria-1]|nr:MAG: butyrate kinase [candidate division Zixibacteria bacterium HGW-Zixibacteria-1]